MGLAAIAAIRPVELPTLSSPPVPSERPAASSYAELPLAFEPNAGRYSRAVRFVASASGGQVALTSSGAAISVATGSSTSDSIRIGFPGADLGSATGADRLPGVVNDLRGDDRSSWRTEIPTFETVTYRSAYPGVDLRFHGSNSGALEYDFVLRAGADPTQLETRISGAESIELTQAGDLEMRAGEATFSAHRPVAFQPADATHPRTRVAASFALDGAVATISLGAYDPDRRLVIDPVLLGYSTYLGGTAADAANAIALDATGAAYFAGSTDSTDYDTLGPIEGDSTDTDAFISKLNPAGNALVFSTYLGGDGIDVANAIAVDGTGAAYVAGSTGSTDFNTVGPIEGDSTNTDVFVAKLTPAGSGLAYSTYLGGGSLESANAIAVDAGGAAYVAGQTDSSDFDTLGQIELDSVARDAFISKLTAAGNALTFSTYLGGGGSDFANGIAVDSAGAAYVTGATNSTDFNTVGQIEGDSAGQDTFISKLAPAGNALTYSTYLGGGGSETASGIAVDATGAAYITGNTDSTDFNTVGPIEGDSASNDVFVSKLTPAGSSLAYSTYLGGSDADLGNAIAIDAAGSAYVAGNTLSTDFDTLGAIEGDSNISDAFVSKLTPAGGALVYSTYLGGASTDVAKGIAVDALGAAYIAGFTLSNNFDTLGQVEGFTGGDRDAFVSKLDPDQDGDAIRDSADNCPAAANADQLDTDGDAQGDACDGDDDGDGVADGADNCQTTVNADQGNLDGDAQGDACDADDDGDGAADGADNCPTSNADQLDSDGDAQGDACDGDDDGDGVADSADSCRVLTGAAANGCPDLSRKVKLGFDPGKERGEKVEGDFSGAVTPAGPCAARVRVSIFLAKRGPDQKLASVGTKANGRFEKELKVSPGTYYAKVKASTVADVGNCRPARSKSLEVEA
jgi:hypothetical protein